MQQGCEEGEAAMRRAAFAAMLLSLCGLVAIAQVLIEDEAIGIKADAPGAGAPSLASAAPLPADTGAVPGPILPDAPAKPPRAPVAAKAIFGAAATPAPMEPRAVGFYSRGCLAGGVALPIDGEVWQAMRLSRNRNWGHPKLIALIERLAEDAAAKDGWPGLLVGDLSQPRGGPMLTGHNSHQVGLDADIWLTPMPERRLSYDEREAMPAQSMLGKDGVHADPEVFTPYHAALIRRAASYPEVERIFIHPGIKKAMCDETSVDRRHFYKVRPYFGHHYHMHVRITCPPGSPGCQGQAAPAHDDGCGKDLDDWLARMKKPPKPEPPVAQAKPQKAPRPITLDDLPGECSRVAAAGNESTLPGAVRRGAAGKQGADKVGLQR
jgi:penicillin-insensitive murein endopeptidase